MNERGIETSTRLRLTLAIQPRDRLARFHVGCAAGLWNKSAAASWRPIASRNVRRRRFSWSMVMPPPRPEGPGLVFISLLVGPACEACVETPCPVTTNGQQGSVRLSALPQLHWTLSKVLPNTPQTLSLLTDNLPRPPSSSVTELSTVLPQQRLANRRSTHAPLAAAASQNLHYLSTPPLHLVFPCQTRTQPSCERIALQAV